MEKKPDFGFNLEAVNLSFSLPGISFAQVPDEPPEEEPAEEGSSPIRVSHRWGHRHLTRKASSEAALSAQLDWHFREGDCYHCFSFGDVDSLTISSTYCGSSACTIWPCPPGAWPGRMWKIFGNGTGAACWAGWTFSSVRSSLGAIPWYMTPRWTSRGNAAGAWRCSGIIQKSWPSWATASIV